MKKGPLQRARGWRTAEQGTEVRVSWVCSGLSKQLCATGVKRAGRVVVETWGSGVV